MTSSPPGRPAEIEPRPLGMRDPRVWSILLMMLFGAGVGVALLVNQFGSGPTTPPEGTPLQVAVASPATRASFLPSGLKPKAKPTGTTQAELEAASSGGAPVTARAVRPVGGPRTGPSPGGTGDRPVLPGGRGVEPSDGVETASADPAPGSAATQGGSALVPPASTDPVGQYGIEIASLHMTAGGNALDFRYKVVDPEKAARLGREGGLSYILDQEGRRISPRNVQHIGDYFSARHLDRPGYTYSTWFANQGGTLRSGDLVSVVMGDLHVANVRVE